jgi:hypothetical protein
VNRRLFLWGLSNGATVLALAGAFWIGLGIGMVSQHVHWVVPAVGTVIQVGGSVALILAAVRLRRRSGFQRSELRRFEGFSKGQQRHIVKWMRWTTVGQTLLISVLVWMCVTAKAEHLIWGSIGVVVSLHFAPLAKIFHVRTYYFASIAGTIACAAGFAVSSTPYGVASLGLVMATIMWVSAAHVLVNADRIADQACAEHWVG